MSSQFPPHLPKGVPHLRLAVDNTVPDFRPDPSIPKRPTLWVLTMTTPSFFHAANITCFMRTDGSWTSLIEDAATFNDKAREIYSKAFVIPEAARWVPADLFIPPPPPPNPESNPNPTGES